MDQGMNTARFNFTALFVAISMATAPAAVGAACERTTGSSQPPSKTFPPSENWYGSEQLAVILPRDGAWRGLGPTYDFRDKLFFWSVGFEAGSEKNLQVTGVRLDGNSPPAVISKATNAYAESLGGWTMLVLVELPSAGCWQITAEYLGEKLTFVVETQIDNPDHAART